MPEEIDDNLYITELKRIKDGFDLVNAGLCNLIKKVRSKDIIVENNVVINDGKVAYGESSLETEDHKLRAKLLKMIEEVYQTAAETRNIELLKEFKRILYSYGVSKPQELKNNSSLKKFHSDMGAAIKEDHTNRVKKDHDEPTKFAGLSDRYVKPETKEVKEDLAHVKPEKSKEELIKKIQEFFEPYIEEANKKMLVKFKEQLKTYDEAESIFDLSERQLDHYFQSIKRLKLQNKGTQ